MNKTDSRLSEPLVLSAIVMLLPIRDLLHQQFGFFDKTNFSLVNYFIYAVLIFALMKPYVVSRKQEKARQQKENEAAAQAGTYLSGEMTTWK